ncbi:MAG: hypothetical protein WAQ52_05195 [Terriglobales bacterium]
MKRAWRLQRRRKELGSSNPSCVSCGESDIECLENDHPITEDLDPQFKRVECRNDHRRKELNRDLKGLTHNGKRNTKETERQRECRMWLLHAEDLEFLAERMKQPDFPRERASEELLKTVNSMRRRAALLESLPPEGLSTNPTTAPPTPSTK